MFVVVVRATGSGSVAGAGVLDVEVDETMVRRKAVPADRRVDVTEEMLLVESLLLMSSAVNTGGRGEEVQSCPERQQHPIARNPPAGPKSASSGALLADPAGTTDQEAVDSSPTASESSSSAMVARKRPRSSSRAMSSTFCESGRVDVRCVAVM
jgi:hypothetical protein